MTRLARPSVALVALLGLGIASCGGSASPAPSTAASTAPSPTAQPTMASPSASSSPSPTAGPSQDANLPLNGRIEVASRGYAITLPDNWRRVDLDPQAVADLLAENADQFPEGMAQAIESQIGGLMAQGVSLFAFRDPDDQAAAGTTLNILSLPSLGMSLDTLETLNVGQLEAMLGAGAAIETERVTLPAGEALRFAYELPIGGSQTAGTIQYLIVAESEQLVLSCGAPSGIAAIADECEAIARSLEILP